MDWITGNIYNIIYWTDNLFSLIIHAPVNNFIAGQFTKLALKIDNKNIQRAYSYVNAPYDKNLEFYLTLIPGGILSPLLYNLKKGDNINIAKKAAGCFIIDNIPICDNLWMLATGTAIGPYLSILQQNKSLNRFNNIILVYATRFIKDMSYLPRILQLQANYNGKLRVQTIVSREIADGSLNGRIPNLIANGSLESSVNLKLDPKNSHVMLCGNPKMVSDTQLTLFKIGMSKHFRHKPGHITTENYW